MNESEFNRIADATIYAIEEALENCGVDIDFDNAGDILSLEFSNGSQIIINKQRPLSQIWVAARSGGYHFDYDADNERWCRDSSGEELFECLARYCSEQAGETVEL